MKLSVRRRFWVESLLAALSGLGLVATLVWRDWIEIIFEVDPDGHNGALEWLIVGALFACTMTFALAAREEWRLARSPGPGLTAPAGTVALRRRASSPRTKQGGKTLQVPW